MTDTSVVYTVEVLHPSTRYTLQELCEISQLTEELVIKYIDYEVIFADGPNGIGFTHTQLDRLMKAFRLQRDLEINTSGVALIIELLDSNQKLERRISQLEKRSMLVDG